MKKILAVTIGLMLMTSAAFAGGSPSFVPTKYPVVLVHGIAMNDLNVLGVEYFYGVKSALEEEGYTVFTTTQDCMNSTAIRAQEVFNELLYIKATHPSYTKFNIVAHSQGALDARYMASNLSAVVNGRLVRGSDLVASITSISGVHRGSPVADLVLGLLPTGVSRDLAATIVNLFYQAFFRNETADAKNAVINLSTAYMTKTFNPNVPNVAGIYYQSWAGRIKTATPTFIVSTPLNLYISSIDGPNDCMVSVNSAKWGTFRGELTGAWWCGGLDHFMEIGHLFGITPGFSAPDFYLSVASDLQKRGY